MGVASRRGRSQICEEVEVVTRMAAVDSGTDAGSPSRRSAALLASRVVAARTQQRLTWTRLQEITGLSARTIRDIESGNAERRYSPNTLAALDEAFGWEEQTAWSIWRGENLGVTETERNEIAEQMAALRQTVEKVTSQPPSLAQLIELASILSPEERRWLLDMAVIARGLSVEAQRTLRDVGEELG